jgi:tellurite resistance protein
MRRLLFAGLIAVADAADGISPEELEIFAKFFGKYAFTEKLDIEKIKQTVDRRAAQVKQRATQTQAMQVLHDMCVMAQADGGVRASERLLLERVAQALNIPSSFVCQVIDADKDLD